MRQLRRDGRGRGGAHAARGGLVRVRAVGRRGGRRGRRTRWSARSSGGALHDRQTALRRCCSSVKLSVTRAVFQVAAQVAPVAIEIAALLRGLAGLLHFCLCFFFFCGSPSFFFTHLSVCSHHRCSVRLAFPKFEFWAGAPLRVLEASSSDRLGSSLDACLQSCIPLFIENAVPPSSCVQQQHARPLS